MSQSSYLIILATDSVALTYIMFRELGSVNVEEKDLTHELQRQLKRLQIKLNINDLQKLRF